jgi:hypothetical protein
MHMAHEERWPVDQVIQVREGVAELRATVRHIETEVADLRGEVRRLDTRLFQLLLAQLATLATALGALVASLAA